MNTVTAAAAAVVYTRRATEAARRELDIARRKSAKTLRQLVKAGESEADVRAWLDRNFALLSRRLADCEADEAAAKAWLISDTQPARLAS